jgi:hypothetical protein
MTTIATAQLPTQGAQTGQADAPLPANATWRELPAKPGTVIAWTLWYDGPRYGCAVLEQDDETGEPIWFRAGFDAPLSPQRLRELLRDNWTEVGHAPELDR